MLGGTYYDAGVACKFAKVGRFSVVLVVRTTSPIGVVEDVEVVVISVVAVKNIANGIQEWGFPTPVSVQVLMTPFWGLYVDRRYRQTQWTKDISIAYLIVRVPSSAWVSSAFSRRSVGLWWAIDTHCSNSRKDSRPQRDLTSGLDDALKGTMDNLGEEIVMGTSLVNAISRAAGYRVSGA